MEKEINDIKEGIQAIKENQVVQNRNLSKVIEYIINKNMR